ncbi:MAG: hypothetical protein GY854_32385 [Deltaproteobacteria bacterium]|nr:hypothetical protein [Deltaproteobacteria bacterium]
MGIISGRRHDEVDSSDRSIVLLTGQTLEQFHALEDNYQRYQKGETMELSQRDIRRLFFGLKDALVLVETWRRKQLMNRSERFPFFWGIAFKVIVGVLVMSVALVSFLLKSQEPSHNEGLSATYFARPDFTGKRKTRVDHQVNFKWAAGSPIDGMPRNNFSIRWHGCLIVEEGESKILTAGADDGIMVYLDDALFIDNGGKHSFRHKTAARPLKQGLYRIKVDYVEIGDHAQVYLGWSDAEKKPKAIPHDRFIAQGQSHSGYRCPPMNGF